MQDIIDRALRTAFGTAAHDGATPADGRDERRAHPARRHRRAAPSRAGRRESARGRRDRDATIQAAAPAGLAPRVWYASVEDRAMITDFVEARPFTRGAAAQLAALIPRLQALPPFARAHHLLDFTDRFVAAHRTAGAEDVLAGYAAIAAAFPRDALVACHNDLKPANVVVAHCGLQAASQGRVATFSVQPVHQVCSCPTGKTSVASSLEHHDRYSARDHGSIAVPRRRSAQSSQRDGLDRGRVSHQPRRRLLTGAGHATIEIDPPFVQPVRSSHVAGSRVGRGR